MSGKRVWYNEIERNAWVEKNCRICFQPDEAILRVSGQGVGCPHKARGDAGKLPNCWTRRNNAVIGETYRCSELIKQPPVNRRGVAPAATASMFDPEPDDYRLVPVDGWPDYRAEAKKQKDGDHQ